MSRNRVFWVLLSWYSCCFSPVILVGSFPLKFPELISELLSQGIFMERCMGELGCFSNGPPFFDITERPISLLPEYRETINTRFMLFTRKNPRIPQNASNLNINENTAWMSTFEPNLNTKFIIPGFMSNLAPEWTKPLTNVLLEKEDLNVCLVDWTDGDGPIYEQAVANTRVVGAEIAQFVKFLQDNKNVKPESIHLIGHSLGSHIAGYAGKRIHNLSRITGLDPAGPYFENVKPVVRLDSTDAMRVEAIHTNAAKSIFTGFGTTESIGDYDFFPNGGHLQPGCPDTGSAILSFFKNPLQYTETLSEIMCNHQRSVELYISNLNNTDCKLSGVVCSSWDDFQNGKCGHCGKNSEGCISFPDLTDRPSLKKNEESLNVYLKTNSVPPFCVKD